MGGGFFCRPATRGPRGATISPQFKPIPGTIDRRVGSSAILEAAPPEGFPAQQAAGKMLEQSLIGREEDDDRSLADEASTPEGATHA